MKLLVKMMLAMMPAARKRRTLSTALAVVTNSQMMVNVLDVTPVGGGTTIAVPASIVFQKKASNGAATSAVISDALL